MRAGYACLVAADFCPGRACGLIWRRTVSFEHSNVVTDRLPCIECRRHAHRVSLKSCTNTRVALKPFGWRNSRERTNAEVGARGALLASVVVRQRASIRPSGGGV